MTALDPIRDEIAECASVTAELKLLRPKLLELLDRGARAYSAIHLYAETIESELDDIDAFYDACGLGRISRRVGDIHERTEDCWQHTDEYSAHLELGAFERAMRCHGTTEPCLHVHGRSGGRSD